MHKTTDRLPFNTGVTFLLVLARNLDFRGTCCLEIFNVNPIRTRFFWFSETEVLRGRALGRSRELFSPLVFRSLSSTIGEKILLLLCREPALLSFRKNKTPCIMGVLWPARARCRGFKNILGVKNYNYTFFWLEIIAFHNPVKWDREKNWKVPSALMNENRQVGIVKQETIGFIFNWDISITQPLSPIPLLPKYSMTV